MYMDLQSAIHKIVVNGNQKEYNRVITCNKPYTEIANPHPYYCHTCATEPCCDEAPHH